MKTPILLKSFTSKEKSRKEEKERLEGRSVQQYLIKHIHSRNPPHP